MNILKAIGSGRCRCATGVTLIEVVISMAIAGITISSIGLGFVGEPVPSEPEPVTAPVDGARPGRG